MVISFKGRRTARLQIKPESKIILFLFGNNSIFLVKWSEASPAVEHTPPRLVSVSTVHVCDRDRLMGNIN